MRPGLTWPYVTQQQEFNPVLADCQKSVVELDKLGKEKLSCCLFDPAAASNVNKKAFYSCDPWFP